MPFNVRLDRIIGFIQHEHDKAAAQADARRACHTRHHDLLLVEDEMPTITDDEDEDHWREGDAHVVRPFPKRPTPPHAGLEPIPEEGASERPCPERPRGSAHHDPSSSPCASCGAAIYRPIYLYKDKVLGVMIDRLAGMELDASMAPDARRAWAVAISAVETDDPVAVRAVVRACQEGVRPEDAMQRVVDAVMGGGTKSDDAGSGLKRRIEGGQNKGHDVKQVKHVACECM